MPTTITAQGCDVSDPLRERAQGLGRRWPRYDPAVMDTRFVFAVEGRTHLVEAIIARRRSRTVVARGEGPGFRGALDQLDDRVKRILKRDRSRRTDHRASRDSRA